MRSRLTPKNLVQITDREIPLVMSTDYAYNSTAHIIRQEGKDKHGHTQHITLCNRVISFWRTITTVNELDHFVRCQVCSKRANFEETIAEYNEKWNKVERQRKQKREEKDRIRAERYARDQATLSAFLAKKFTLEEVGGKESDDAIVTWSGRQFKIDIIPLEEEN